VKIKIVITCGKHGRYRDTVAQNADMEVSNMAKKEINPEDEYTSTMRARDIDMDGVWRPNNGERVFDLRDIKFAHSMIDGKENMTAFFNDPRGYYDLCPCCNKAIQEDDAIIVLENYHYLVMRHCDRMMLYKNKDLKKREWK
tara:strand:+ start:64 stop:489 length:426 start_codon:yes stop_codon:yes gene_type:complete